MVSVTRETKGAAALIRYANGPRHYLTAEGCEALLKALSDAMQDAAVRTIILTGTDDVFIRHYDVSEIMAIGGAVRANAIEPSAFESGAFVDLMNMIFEGPKPVIAAINGTCMGGGFELSLACDFRIAARHVTQIGLPETRVGIFPGGGGTQRLPRLIGEAKALDFIMRGQVVDAGAAYDLGLVTSVAEDAVAGACALADELATRPAAGMTAAKRLVRSALTWGLTAGLREEQHAFHAILKEDSAMDAMQDFLDNGEDITR